MYASCRRESLTAVGTQRVSALRYCTLDVAISLPGTAQVFGAAS
jgi:hypothetical protein